MGGIAFACLGACFMPQLNSHAALLIGLSFHSDWRVLALGWACLPWGLPLATFGDCLGAFLWLSGLRLGWACSASGGLAFACLGACLGLVLGAWGGWCWGVGWVVLGCGVWLWLQPLGGKGAQRQGGGFFCLHRGLGWGSAILLGSSGWLVVACVFRFSPCPAGLGRKNTFIVVSARLLGSSSYS